MWCSMESHASVASQGDIPWARGHEESITYLIFSGRMMLLEKGRYPDPEPWRALKVTTNNLNHTQRPTDNGSSSYIGAMRNACDYLGCLISCVFKILQEKCKIANKTFHSRRSCNCCTYLLLTPWVGTIKLWLIPFRAMLDAELKSEHFWNWEWETYKPSSIYLARIKPQPGPPHPHLNI